MLCLGEHVSRDVARIAFFRYDDDLSRAGHKIDSDLASQQLLRCRNINISRPDDAIYSRHGRRSKRERRNGLRSAHPENVLYPEELSARQDLGAWIG